MEIELRIAKTLQTLIKSADPVDRDLAKALLAWQNIKVANNKLRNLGYEPRDIIRLGSVEVIERRIRNNSNGFNEVPAKDSYESIVIRHPERFAADVIKIAKHRIDLENSEFAPSADEEEIDEQVQKLLTRKTLTFPTGILQPQRVDTTVAQFLRSAHVKAFVLKLANGRCENCGADAPFQDKYGRGYLEVHHVKSLSDGGSDRVSKCSGSLSKLSSRCSFFL